MKLPGVRDFFCRVVSAHLETFVIDRTQTFLCYVFASKYQIPFLILSSLQTYRVFTVSSPQPLTIFLLLWMSLGCCHFTTENMRPRDRGCAARGINCVLANQNTTAINEGYELCCYSKSPLPLDVCTAQLRLHEGLSHTVSHLILMLYREWGGMTSTLWKLCEVWPLAQRCTAGKGQSLASLSISSTPVRAVRLPVHRGVISLYLLQRPPWSMACT